MIALPTARGRLLILMAFGAVCVALVNVGLATALAASAFCSLLAASFLMAQFSLYGIRVERKPNCDGVCGTEITLPLVVTNRTFLFRQSTVVTEICPFAPGGRLHSVVPPLRPRQSLTLDRSCMAEKRGWFTLSLLRVSGGDPAGLFRRTRKFRLPGEIQIYPRTVRLDSIPLYRHGNSMASFDGRPLGQSGHGQEFFGLRPYRPGDEVRFIHWKGMAAKRQLMIREFEANTVDRIVILLDTRSTLVGNDPRENNLEYLICAAASLTEHLKEMYCRILFFAADGRTGKLIRLSGDAAGIHRRLRQTLMMIEPAELSFTELLQETAEEIPHGSLVYALSLDDDDSCAGMLELLFDSDCLIRWIRAPKANFPEMLPDEPRIVYGGRKRKQMRRMVKPLDVCFCTRLEEVLEK